MAEHSLDVKGLNCPLSIMQAKKTMKSLESGDTLEIFSTDTESVKDFDSLCQATGNEMLERDETDGVFRFLLKKA